MQEGERLLALELESLAEQLQNERQDQQERERERERERAAERSRILALVQERVLLQVFACPLLLLSCYLLFCSILQS